MAVAAEIQVRDKLYIGGEWVDPAGSETIDVVNASTEEVMGRIPQGTPEDVDRAVAAARRAFESWSQTELAERAELIRAIAAGLAARSEEIAATIAQELGMPIVQSTGDPGRSADDDVHLRARPCSRTSPGARRSATRSSCASPSAWWARSRPGTTRCTRSPRRSRPRSRSAARSC